MYKFAIIVNIFIFLKINEILIYQNNLKLLHYNIHINSY